MDSSGTSFGNNTPTTSPTDNTPATSPEPSALPVHYEQFHDCNSLCPNGAAASRDLIARIVRSASETDVQDGSKRFICRHSLVKNLSAGTVSSLLSACPRGKGQRRTREDKTAAYISPEEGSCDCERPRCTGARIIFVVLSLIAREEYVWDLVGSGICDGALPACIRESRLVSCENKSRCFPEMTGGLTMEEKKLFCHFQWAMLTPYFERRAVSDPEIRQLAVEVSLPWCEYGDPEENGDSEGDAGFQFDEKKTVMKRIKISKHYHDLDSEDGHFALKRQRRSKREWPTFKNEIEGNARTRQCHKHIIALLDAFNHAGLCYMLFPWAEGGSLDAFWKRYASPPGKYEPADPSWRTPAWAWDQCCGLAGALAFLHGYPVCEARAVPQWHGDIQPRNILCSRATDPRAGASYILQISDFEFSQKADSPDSTITVEYPNVAAWYHPPEIRVAEIEEVKITLRGDVWCLACVYLEFLSWFAFGYEKGIKWFVKEREKVEHDETARDELGLPKGSEAKFFRLVSTQRPRSRFMRGFIGRSTVTIDAEVSPAVKKHTARLRTWGKDKDWWRDGRMKRLISLVEDGMMVTDVGRRATSEAVLRVLTSKV